MWLRHTQLGERDGIWVVVTENQLAHDWLENRLRNLIKKTLTGLFGHSKDLIVEASPKVERQ